MYVCVCANMLKHVVPEPELLAVSSHMLDREEGDLHPRQLQRRGTPPEEHSVHEHPVFTQTPQVEVSRASAVVGDGKYLQMPAGDEAGVAHAHVHGALGGVPADGYRPLLHHVFEFTALEPGDRPGRSAYHGHDPEVCTRSIYGGGWGGRAF